MTRAELEQEQRQRILDRLLADLQRARDRGERWYVEALQTAQAFNRRPLVDRQTVPYDHFPAGY